MKNTIFLDLDDTILDFRTAERTALTKTFRAFGVSPTDQILDRYHIINREYWQMLERRELTRDEVKTKRYIQLFDEFSLTPDPHEFTTLYESQLGQGHYFVDHALEVIRALHSTGHRLYIVTNGSTEVQNSRIDSAGIRGYFEDIFISEEIGADKPAKAFFDHCFSRIPDIDLSRTIIVGDSLTGDIQGGNTAGITTVWFNPINQANNTDIHPDHEISSLRELIKFVIHNS